ncbi:hypothetical protein RN001_014649 [Aquatica leii]|uniref:Uncharacterized protein n=1 Tax=Aquatica leii TaxID=1421715 RepID=A0AAN7NUR9_9COLE|nr:hypothetical protein RN001_014649 [Aquatica leii]
MFANRGVNAPDENAQYSTLNSERSDLQSKNVTVERDDRFMDIDMQYSEELPDLDVETETTAIEKSEIISGRRIVELIQFIQTLKSLIEARRIWL